jgi:hypothetical protein
MSDMVIAKFHDSEISKADDFNFAAYRNFSGDDSRRFR